MQVQSIPTLGPRGWEYLTTDSCHYLAVANHQSDSNFALNSAVYQLKGGQFVQVQTFPTMGAQDWEHFTSGMPHFLAVTNAHSSR